MFISSKYTSRWLRVWFFEFIAGICVNIIHPAKHPPTQPTDLTTCNILICCLAVDTFSRCFFIVVTIGVCLHFIPIYFTNGFTLKVFAPWFNDALSYVCTRFGVVIVFCRNCGFNKSQILCFFMPFCTFLCEKTVIILFIGIWEKTLNIGCYTRFFDPCMTPV